MRLAAWNVNHRTLEKPIPPGLLPALLSLEAEIVVLTEYVPGADHQALCDGLRSGGLPHVHMSPRAPGQNQVLIATESRSIPGELRGPEQLPHAASNYLHLRLPSQELEVIGLRVPMYQRSADVRAYWTWFEAAVSELRDRPLVILGDFNATPELPRSAGGRCLRRMAGDGWHLAVPTRGWSFYSAPFRRTSRIDLALVSHTFAITAVRYVAHLAGHVFAGPDGGAMSDHAAIVLEIARASAEPRAGVATPSGC